MDANRLGGNGRQVADRRFSRRQMLRTSGVGLAAGGLAATGVGRVGAQGATAPAPSAPPGEVNAARVALAVERLPAVAQDILARTDVPGMELVVVYDDAV